MSEESTNPKHFYKYKDGTFSNIVVSGSTRAATTADRDTTAGTDGVEFNASLLRSNAPVVSALYYFEIPVNNGEFAMGFVSTATAATQQGAYLIYLDIGANGDTIESDKVTAYYITTIGNANAYPIGVDFAPVTVNGNGGESIGVYIDSGKRGTIVFSVNSSTSAIIIDETPYSGNDPITTYSFIGTKYSDSDPPSGNFVVTGDSPGAISTPSGGGTRVLIIDLTTVADVHYVARITDVMSDATTIASSTYELDSGSGFVTSSYAAINALSTEVNINNMRALNIAVTLTRTDGVGEFTTTYDTANCGYATKTIDVDIVTNGTTISIAVATGYTFKIGGTPYANNSTYSG